MNFSIPRFLKNIWERDYSGNSTYIIDQYGEWGIEGSNLHIAQTHPILTPSMLFVSKLYSQAKFTLENENNGKIIKKHWILELLKNPNPYQTGKDFLESQMFMQIAQGKAVVYLKKTTGQTEIDSIYILNSDLIEWPEDFITSMVTKATYKKLYANKKIIYDKDHENKKIKLKDLLFFYDMPNGTNYKNKFQSASRLDGLKQTLINTNDSLIAKNIILKSNGKELVTGEKTGFPLSPEEKTQAENMFNSKYGLSNSKKRTIITMASLSWKSLHIALRDLGLDESVKVDGNLIYTALHIPKDILSLEAKKTTYNNFKESMVSYIQNEIQSSLDATVDVFQKLLKDEGLVLKGTYNHLPVMQFILKQLYVALKLRADALDSLISVGIPQEDALELCGFDRNLKLEEIKSINNGTGQQTNETNTANN